MSGDNIQQRSRDLIYGSRLGSYLSRSASGRSIQRNAMKLLARGSAPPCRPKVLCVGWLKTGTTSFAHAMRRLGYWHYTWDQDIARVWYKQDADISRMLRFAKSFESFDDVPWSRLEFVDAFAAAYPDAKYVLLERDMDEWHDSLVRFRQKRGIVARTSREEDIAEHLERIHYLSGKFSGEQMLRMNVFDGDGYDKLCPFLGLPVPADPFPRVNVNTTVRAR